MGKSKKEKRKSEVLDETIEDGNEGGKEQWDEKVRYLSPISQPLASRKLTKKLYKVMKKASQVKQVRKGIRECQKFVRKGERGIMILAGNVSPVDVISHMPVVCEESGIPYCYVPSKEDLGSSVGSKRQMCMALIKPHDDYSELYEQCFTDVKGMPLPL